MVRERQGRSDGAPSLSHFFQRGFGHLERMEDQIDARPCTITRRFVAPGMSRDLLAEPVDFVDDRNRLSLVERGHMCALGIYFPAIHCDLDKIDAVFDLEPYFLDRLVDAADEMADRGRGLAEPGRVPVGTALAGRQIGARAGNPRSFEQPRVDGIADRNRNPGRAAGVCH